MNTDQQINEMRQQMAELKQQLDRQEIVNERLIRQSMSSKMSWIKRYIWVEVALVPLCLLIFAPIHALLGLSWWLYAFMTILLVADVIADYRINRIDKNQLLSGNLVEASTRLAAMKRRRAWAFVLGMMGVIVWLVWLLYEFKRVAGEQSSDFLSGFNQGGFVGAIIGAIIGVTMAVAIFRKMQRTNDEVLAQIDQLTQ